MAVQRCVVRIRSDLKAEALASAIASTKVMKAQQVVKSESGEEMLVPFQDTPVEVEQNTELPDYLPEDESPTKEQDKAVSRVGSHPEGGQLAEHSCKLLSRSFYWWLHFGAQGLCERTRGQFSIVVVNCQVQFAISYHEKFLDYKIEYAASYILLDILPH